jgi:hypothetical protein
MLRYRDKLIRTFPLVCSKPYEADMTDAQLTHPGPISAKRVTFALLVTAIIGSSAALAASSQLLATSYAVAIVSIGKYDPSSSIEEPQSFIERVKSSSFAAAISGRAGIPELAMLLPAAQYGGSGAISARSLRDPNLIEIRVSLQEPELALKAVTAAVDELMADHEAKVAPLIQNLQSDVALLSRHASEMVKTSETVTKRASGASQNEEAGKDSTALLSALALTESGLAALINDESRMRGVLFDIRRSQVIAVPTVTTTKATSAYRIITAGALAGLLVGLLLLQLFPGVFRTGQPRLGVSRPDPA